MLVSPRNIIS